MTISVSANLKFILKPITNKVSCYIELTRETTNQIDINYQSVLQKKIVLKVTLRTIQNILLYVSISCTHSHLTYKHAKRGHLSRNGLLQFIKKIYLSFFPLMNVLFNFRISIQFSLWNQEYPLWILTRLSLRETI